jgi:flavin reductase (DIM6/NTAB) family NADH-FMN oxidoreductase RutF
VIKKSIVVNGIKNIANFQTKKQMIDFEALFKITYGLYIVSSGDKNHGNGFISNSVFQVTADPATFAICCNKNNYTAEFIKRTGVYSVSVLHTAASPDLFGRFGYRSGKDFDKMQGVNVIYGENTAVPVVLNDSIAFLECRVLQTVDVGTHFLFIGELLHSEILDDFKDPMTYSYYRQTRKGVAPKNAPTYIDKSKLEPKKQATAFKKYECTACGYIYDEAIEGIKFSDLPADWVCPNCGTPKEDFIEMQ